MYVSMCVSSRYTVYVAVLFGETVSNKTDVHVTVNMTEATNFNRIKCQTFVCREPSHPNHCGVYIQ